MIKFRNKQEYCEALDVHSVKLAIRKSEMTIKMRADEMVSTINNLSDNTSKLLIGALHSMYEALFMAVNYDDLVEIDYSNDILDMFLISIMDVIERCMTDDLEINNNIKLIAIKYAEYLENVFITRWHVVRDNKERMYRLKSDFYFMLQAAAGTFTNNLRKTFDFVDAVDPYDPFDF